MRTSFRQMGWSCRSWVGPLQLLKSRRPSSVFFSALITFPTLQVLLFFLYQKNFSFEKTTQQVLLLSKTQPLKWEQTCSMSCLVIWKPTFGPVDLSNLKTTLLLPRINAAAKKVKQAMWRELSSDKCLTLSKISISREFEHRSTVNPRTPLQPA